jgi:hypothetical protein
MALMPAMNMAQATHRRNELVHFVQKIMVLDTDFGKVPGTDKDTLFKPGAEKLTTFFGLSPRFEIIREIEQWDGDEPLFYYLIRCRLYRGDYPVGEADGSCNSRESRYRFRWVQEHEVPPGLDKSKLKRRGGKTIEPKFAIERGQTQGKYGKPDEYWQAFRDAIEKGTAKETIKPTRDGRAMEAYEIDMTTYRVPNEDIFSQINTILKMAEKRALVAATLITVNASEFFTQDLEDLDIIDVPHTVAPVQQPASQTQPYEQPTGDLFPNGDPGHAVDIAEAQRELEDLGPEPRRATRRSWPSSVVIAIIDAHLDGGKGAPAVVGMLNLSEVITPSDELELILTWANHYRSAREDKEPADAARWADEQMPEVEG